MNRTKTFLGVALSVGLLTAQNVGIGTNTPHASARLHVFDTQRGVLIPNVSLAAQNSISPIVNPPGPALSLLVYNNATAGSGADAVSPGYYYWNGTRWVRLLTGTNGGGEAWLTLGNAGTNPNNNFIGTTDAQPLVFRTNNAERMRIFSTGQVGVNTGATIDGTDLMAVQGTVTYPWAINGYTTGNGGAVFASSTGTTAYSAVDAARSGGAPPGQGPGGGVIGYYTGSSPDGFGVTGQYTGTSNTGVRVGVRGYSTSNGGNLHVGVVGNYNTQLWGIGVVGLSFGGAYPGGNQDIAVVGLRANNANWAGYFNGNHTVVNGTKSASVATSKGNQHLYVIESPEIWFEEIGGGQLVNGEARIELDPLFLETVFIDERHPMHVFIQLEGEANDVYVIKDKTGFTVKEKNGGRSNVPFSYRVVAKRRGYQDHRFGNDPIWGPGDTRKYAAEYVPPPPIDYHECVKFWEEQKRNWKPTPLPEGFVWAHEWEERTRPAMRAVSASPQK